MPLVLASSSPRRRDLLARLGVVPDRVASPDIDEAPRPAEPPRVYALRLAVEKAQAVERADDEIVVAGDTTIALGRRILPPAETEDVQRKLLRLMSGRRHHALSAVCVIDATGKARTRLADTIVAFKPLSDDEIDAYIACGEGLGKAGGYAIQGRAEAFVRFLQGSHSGVIGLPLFETRALLKAAGLPLV
ncbi:septum formation protein Maf [Sphingomonas sp. Sph1(2015)]|jgi:septum formation protein|uniref:Maf family protein n=1 Tax=Sphingomonas sp. Sph1(2015) TaxID=1628084 RepID=UPI000975F315|nr:nucleoside triphosphate pyrophosphatase [Sphingomonas sp. Sph1(2015)]OMJ33619.1 septum formation protein Maf [Sphingomonas sp. Sph1(2015)]